MGNVVAFRPHVTMNFLVGNDATGGWLWHWASVCESGPNKGIAGLQWEEAFTQNTECHLPLNMKIGEGTAPWRYGIQ